MGKRDDLVFSGKKHVMVAHNRAAPNGADADFLRIALFPAPAPVIDVLILLPQRIIHGIREGNRRAAGRVDFQVMVFFDDFHVKTGTRQNRRRFLQKLQQQVDAERHIGGTEHGDIFRCLRDKMNLIRR